MVPVSDTQEMVSPRIAMNNVKRKKSRPQEWNCNHSVVLCEV
jgi:hypothetical protein